MKNSTYKQYVKDIDKYEPLTPEEEKEVGKILANPDASEAERCRAKHKLINHNLKYVVKLALEYKNKSGWKGIDIMDIIGAGNVGLMTAVDKYNWEVGRFLTYATSWIRLYIQRTQNSMSNLVSKPEHIIKMIVHIKRIQEKLEQLLGRSPCVEEIVAAMDGEMDESKVEELIIHGNNSVVSLDSAPEGNEDDMSYSEVIPDAGKTPEEKKLQLEKKKALAAALASLPYVNRRVIELNFGLTEEGQKTLDEIKDILYDEGYGNPDGPYSKQNISLIQKKGIVMIQSNPQIMKILAEFAAR